MHLVSKWIKFHDSMLAMMVLSGPVIDISQIFPILSASVGSQSFSSDESSDEIIGKMKFESVASVLHQCDKGPSSS